MSESQQLSQRDKSGCFVTGVSGNPAGRPKGAKGRVRGILSEIANADTDTGQSRLKRLLDALFTKAESGDLNAIKIVLERLEGPPIIPEGELDMDTPRIVGFKYSVIDPADL
jgi:hypothetical protein